MQIYSIAEQKMVMDSGFLCFTYFNNGLDSSGGNGAVPSGGGKNSLGEEPSSFLPAG